MFGGIGFGAEKLGLAALKFPKLAAVCLALLILAIAASLPRVAFDDDIHRVFLSDSPVSVAERAYQASQSPPQSTLLIHVTATQAFSAADMTTLRNLSLDLEFIKGVIGVASPFILRMPPDGTSANGRPVFGPEIQPDYRADLAAFTDLKTGLPTVLNKTQTAMLISATINTDATTIAAALRSITAEITATLPPGITATLTGKDAISAEIVAGLKSDLIALNLWGALIVTLAAFALLRDLRMAFLAVLPALIGAAGVLALSVWLSAPITVLSNVIPILLLVLGVADGVHLAGHLKTQNSPNRAVTDIGPACALTALTTALAFASIMLSGNDQLFEFALLGALGTLLSFVIVLTTFALLARHLSLSGRAIPPISATFAQHLSNTGRAKPRLTLAACLGLLALCTIGFSQTKAWFPLYQNLPDNSPTIAANDAITKDFGGAFQLIVQSDGDWAQTRFLAEQIEALSPPQTVLSELTLARWLGHADSRPTKAERDTLPPALITQLRPTAETSRIFVSLPEPMRNPQTLESFDALHQTALNAGADRIFGLPIVMRLEAVRLIDQLSFGLIIASLGATFLVAAAFRAPTLVPILIIPNTLPLMLTGASLHLWAQGQLTPTAVLALTIAFGIAIDDTVHFLSRYMRAKASGQPARQAITTAAQTAGQVMVLTTLVLTLGLSVTLFSDFTPVRQFGGLMIITLWAALLIDLLLLPALLSLRKTPQ